MAIKPGCRVKVKVFKDHLINLSDSEPFAKMVSVKVLCFDPTDSTYCILIGDHLSKDRGVEMTSKTIEKWKELEYVFLDTAMDYRGERIVWAREEQMKPDDLLADGEFCRKCGTFSPFSLPNQMNGGFICYGCRRTVQ